MSRSLKLNALMTLALALAFGLFFMQAKHQPALATVNPFAEDPYDAVGSFAIQAAALIALLAVLRAFWPYGRVPTPTQVARLARTQALAALAVIVTLAADLVAMGRDPALWIHAPAGVWLAALLGVLLLAALGVLLLAARAVRGLRPAAAPRAWWRAALVAGAALLVLALYPTALHRGIIGELGTVVLGAALLFAPMWALSLALVPEQPAPAGRRAVVLPLALVVLLGLALGVLLVLAESTEPGSGPGLHGMLFVASVYIGLETSGLVIGYGFLRRPLGLFAWS